jgi:hypothetical protein
MDYDKHADLLASFLIKADPPQCTVGIYGGYGTGKTTLMRAMERNLREVKGTGPPFLVVWFDPWRHDAEDKLIVPFLMAVQQAFKKRGAEQKEDEKTGKCAQAGRKIINTVRALTYGVTFDFGPVSLDASKVLDKEKELKLTEEDKEFIVNYSDIYADTINSLKSLTTEETKDNGGTQTKTTLRIVVFIDDLDRCEPSKALALLEGIKSFMDIPGFMFVLGLDPRVVSGYLDQKYGDAFQVDPNEYLEKMVQLPFNLPDPKDRITEEVKRLADALPENLKSPFAEVALRFPRFNIRQVKRIMNSYQLLDGTIPADVDRRLIVCILAIQVRWREVFGYLRELGEPFLKGLYDGDAGELTTLLSQTLERTRTRRDFIVFFKSGFRMLFPSLDVAKPILTYLELFGNLHFARKE